MEVELARLGELPSSPEDLIEASPTAATTDAGIPAASP
jgi:hypothetical protein